MGLLISGFTLGDWLQAYLAVFIQGRLILLTEGSLLTDAVLWHLHN